MATSDARTTAPAARRTGEIRTHRGFSAIGERTGNCVAVCPTGALMAKTEHDLRERGAWDEARQRTVDTICGYCGVGCALRLHVQDGRIVKVTSPLERSVTRGNLCIKGRFGWKYLEACSG